MWLRNNGYLAVWNGNLVYVQRKKIQDIGMKFSIEDYIVNSLVGIAFENPSFIAK